MAHRWQSALESHRRLPKNALAPASAGNGGGCNRTQQKMLDSSYSIDERHDHVNIGNTPPRPDGALHAH